MGEAPKRVQLKRTKGWRMPPNTVKVTRPGKWGNPYRVGDVGRYGITIRAADAVERFTDRLVTCKLPYTEDDVRRELRGKNLACWCKEGEPCHADVLLEIANRPDA